jgi:hypothetical protein
MYMSIGRVKTKQMGLYVDTWGLGLGVMVGMGIGRRRRFMGVRGFMRGF